MNAIRDALELVTAGFARPGGLPGGWLRTGVAVHDAAVELRFAPAAGGERWFEVVVQPPTAGGESAIAVAGCRAFVRTSDGGDPARLAGSAVERVLSRIAVAARDAAGLRAGDAPPVPWPAPALVAATRAPAGGRQGGEAAAVQLVITHSCQLRCAYCLCETDDPSKSMSPELVRRAVDLLLATRERHTLLHVGGAEPTLRWREVALAAEYARERARALGKSLDIRISTNGQSLGAERIALLARHGVIVDLSIDGGREVHALGRPAKGEQDTYEMLPPTVAALREAGVETHLTMVVHPTVVDRVADSFAHLDSLGARSITIEPAVGLLWAEHARKRFATELAAIAQRHYRDSLLGAPTFLQNARDEDLFAHMCSREVTIDVDGGVYCGISFLYFPMGRDPLRLGHLDEGRTIDEWMALRPTREAVVAGTFSAELLRNNYLVQEVLGTWVDGLRRRFAHEGCATR